MHRATFAFRKTIAGAAVGLLLCAACSELEIRNEPPEARAVALMNGTMLDLSKPVDYPGSPIALTLDGRASFDPDGTIVRALWLRTGVSPNERYAGNGMVDAGEATFAGDPPEGMTPMVSLGEGMHSFSLWVTDDDGMTSEPYTLPITVESAVKYMPDAACVAANENPNAECEACTCTPTEMGGCLGAFQACFDNPDAMFTMLCAAVVACAQSVGCVGSACYTGGCMAQIDAAAMYMGGNLGLCSMGDPATNPCAAASKLGACTNMDAAMTAGPCKTACM